MFDRPGAPRRRSLASRLALAAASSVVALALAEAAVRVLAPQSVLLVEPGLYEDDPPRGHRLHPGFTGTITSRVDYRTTVRVGSAGLRGAELAAKSALRPRVLVIGDSFVFGVGAGESETYPVRLAARLAERGIGAEVLNGGVPGYSVPDAVAWFEAWGAPLAPDLVVLTVFVGNDLLDAMPENRASVIGGRLVVPGADPNSLRSWLYDHSHLYVLLKNSPAGDPIRRALGRPVPHERAEAKEMMSLYAKGAPSEIERVGGAATEEAVRRLVGALPAGHVVAALLPAVIEVDPELWSRNLAAHGLDPEQYDRTRIARWFAALFSRHGVATLDLAPPFAAAIARGEKIYFEHDPHLTPAGYDLAAAEVAPFVAERIAAGAPEARD